MAVPAVFVSSVITDFEEVREQAAEAIERMNMHPVLAERQPANPAASRRAMFDAIARSDYYLLLLGARYGEPGESGKSPTEEEYEEADRLNKPALVIVRSDVAMEPAQQAFLDRVRGNWGEGVFHGRFASPDDVPLAVAVALNAQVVSAIDDIPAAQARAKELSRGEEGQGSMSSGVAARIALVPVRQTTLLDAVALEAPELDARLAEAARRARLIPHAIGIDMTTSAEGVSLVGNTDDDWTTPEAIVAADGSILVVASVRGEGNFVGSVVDPQRLESAMSGAGQFALEAWAEIDSGSEISKVAVSVAIPDAQNKVLGAISGSSMQVPQGLPATVIAPDPALVVARGQLTDGRTIDRLLAEIRRVFQDAGAVRS